MKKIADTINSQFSAEINPKFYYEQVLNRFKNLPYTNYRPVIHLCPDYSSQTDSEYKAHLCKTCGYVNVHRHSPTCSKSASGCFGCRFAKPSGESPLTIIRQLVKNMTSKITPYNIQYPVKEGPDQRERDRNRLPLL